MKSQTRDVAYEKIKKMILSGKLTPLDNISEGSLAKALGISRTPVREAILILETEGFIRIYPNKGPVVVSLGAEDILYISQIREALEGIAARIACTKLDKANLRAIMSKLKELSNLDDQDNEVGFQCGREMHTEIMKCTNNLRMIKIVESLRSQNEWLMKLSRNAPKRSVFNYQEHIRICEAILNEDEDAAELAMRNHIRSVANDAVDVLFKQEYLTGKNLT